MKKEFFREIKTKVKEIRVFQKTFEEHIDGKRVSKEGTNVVYIEVQGNWGNRIYTNKEGANLVHKALLSGEIKVSQDSFETIDNIHKFLKGE